VNALSSVADSLPGLGIVAAVLGVVITMEAIGGSPESVGQKVAAALVGTFLGILLCYGVVSPVAARLENMSEAQTQFFQVIRIAIVSFARGSAPILAIEYARRSIPVELRPSFLDMEASIKREARIPALAKPGDPGGPQTEESDVPIEDG
jgi:chemotaxis protein MotA